MNLIDLPTANHQEHARRHERQLVELRSASPLRGKPGQHDASELDLFRAANEPSLF